jgi:hypothetical protein
MHPTLKPDVENMTSAFLFAVIALCLTLLMSAILIYHAMYFHFIYTNGTEERDRPPNTAAGDEYYQVQGLRNLDRRPIDDDYVMNLSSQHTTGSDY